MRIEPFGPEMDNLFFGIALLVVFLIAMYFLNLIRIEVLRAKLRREEHRDWLMSRRIK